MHVVSMSEIQPMQAKSPLFMLATHGISTNGISYLPIC